MADGNTLDKLVIELEAKGASGTDNITRLTKALTGLSSATKSIDASKLSAMTGVVGKFGESAKVADGSLPKLASGLGNLARSTKNLDTGKLSDFIDKLKGLDGLEVHTKGIGELANGLSKIAKIDFGKVDVEKLKEVTSVIGTLGDSLKGLPENSRINIKIGDGLTKPKVDAADDTSSGSMGDRAAEVADKVRDMYHAVAASTGIWGKLGSIAGIALGGIGKGIKAALPYIAKGVQSFGKLALNIGKIGLSALGKGLANIGKTLNPLNAVGNAIDNLRSKLGMVARLGVFMLLRKAFTALITNAKQGIDNLAMYSDAMGTRFNQSMSTLVSDFKWAGNALATAFEPILNVAIPIIDALITRLVAAMTAFANFIAALTGASTFTRAIKINENYAQSLNKSAGAAGNAGKAAKKAAKDTKSYTTAIDELNILEPNKGSGTGGSGGGGGGAGAGGLDPTSMFETVETTVKAQNWAQMIKDAWEKADFTQIGAIFGQKLKDALDYAHETCG